MLGLLFFLGNNFSNASQALLISEIGTDEKDDWIMLYNPTDSDVDLVDSKYRIERATASGGNPSVLLIYGTGSYNASYPGGNIVPAKGYYLHVRNDASENIRSNADALSDFSLTDSNVIYLASGSVGDPKGEHNNDDDIVDYVGYGNALQYEGSGPAPGPTSKQGIARINDNQDTDDNSVDFHFIDNPFISIEPDPPISDTKYSDDIYLNEIFPNPAGDEKQGEYIEIFNSSNESVSLANWILRDSSKTGQYIFPLGVEIGNSDYGAVYRTDFDFALNNSGEETVYLLNPGEEVVSSVTYSKADEDVSYNFDGTSWRWSKFLTPGKENKFNKLPKIEIKKDKDIYKNIYADFEVNVNDPENEKIKVTWDFGDGHKSYKQKTKHKYEETGRYKASVNINDDSEDVVEELNIEVKDFPRPKVRITQLSPNPEGKDSENEWVLIENKSKKTVNLKNWSVATGASSKKLINHPIHDDFIIESGEARKLIRDFCNFSLNNKKATVELRYPDGKAAHTMKYKRDDGVAEDEIYEKKKGEKWKWVESKRIQEQNDIEASETETTEQEQEQNQEDEELPEEFLGKQSVDENKKDFKIVVDNYNARISIPEKVNFEQGRVLGVSTIGINGAKYVFTKNNYIKRDHYAIGFFKRMGAKINTSINKIILFY